MTDEEADEFRKLFLGIYELCGVVPPPSERQPATLHVHLAQGGGLGLGVWVHPKCLSGCDETDQERGVPW